MKTRAAAVVMVVAGLVAASAVERTARAQAEAPVTVRDLPGFDLGVRVGYALPFGNAVGGSGGALDSVVSSLVPIALDAGYRIDAQVSIGLFLQYGIMQIKTAQNACVPGASCSGSVTSVGAEGLYHLPLPGRFVPWLGLGAGYEWLHLDIAENVGGQTANVSGTLRGAVFGVGQLGGDYHITPELGLGPFVAFSVARYDHTASSGTVNGMPMSISMEITDKGVHEWLVLGVRGTFSL